MKKSLTKLFTLLVCMSLMFQTSFAQTSFSGTVLYHDNVTLPVGNVLVSIKDAQGSTVSSVTTGPNGIYTFTDIPNGNYILTGSTSAPIGGVTMSDASQVLMHILFPSWFPFTPLQSLAGDVNGSGTITMTDFTMIVVNYLTYGQSFPIGNWVFTNQPFSLTGTKDTPPRIGGSSSGDISGVFVPGTRSLETLVLDENASLSVNSGSSFDVSLSSLDNLQLNGAGIVLNYSGNLLKVEAATCKSDEYYVNITENQVRINWIKTDGKAIEFAANEPLVTLTCRTKDNFAEGMSTNFTLDASTSLVNKDYEEINSLKLAMPLLERGKATINLYNSPNPFIGSTIIKYGIPVEGNVRLEILGQTGQLINTVNVGSQTAGNHSINFDAKDLKPGMYFYRLTITGTSTFTETKQMIISN
jgi:flagellar hook assembly protein FlgD